MSFLLDTHAFLWFISGDSQLPASIRSKIEDINQPCFISSASLWEITIKQQLGKLTLDISLQVLFEYLDRNQIELIQINYEHLLSLSKLPTYHSDPFDRLIIAQAIAEDLILVTKDKVWRNIRSNNNGNKKRVTLFQADPLNFLNRGDKCRHTINRFPAGEIDKRCVYTTNSGSLYRQPPSNNTNKKINSACVSFPQT